MVKWLAVSLDDEAFRELRSDADVPGRGSRVTLLHLPFDFRFPASVLTSTASECEAGFQPKVAFGASVTPSADRIQS